MEEESYYIWDRREPQRNEYRKIINAKVGTVYTLPIVQIIVFPIQVSGCYSVHDAAAPKSIETHVDDGPSPPAAFSDLQFLCSRRQCSHQNQI